MSTNHFENFTRNEEWHLGHLGFFSSVMAYKWQRLQPHKTKEDEDVGVWPPIPFPLLIEGDAEAEGEPSFSSLNGNLGNKTCFSSLGFIFRKHCCTSFFSSGFFMGKRCCEGFVWVSIVITVFILITVIDFLSCSINKNVAVNLYL